MKNFATLSIPQKMKNNPCKFVYESGEVCASPYHTAMYHKRSALRTTKPMNKGKKASEWLNFRAKYLVGKKTHQGRYICNDCGLHVENIEVDHIIKRSQRPDLVFDTNNLQLLCHSCHQKKDMT